jgi:serine/threonine-protein kinase
MKEIASRYRILRELGRGGMGVVYVAEHLHTGEHLALKVLNRSGAAEPEVIARFKREARVGAQIKSEHVVRVTDADVAPELDGAPFLVMELLDGSDLEKLVEKCGPLRSDVVLSILGQVGRALDKAHQLGIVHRDLKPENIFLHRREDDTVIAKVLDFGISKFLQPETIDQSSLGATRDGALMGTPYYMSPEQARGEVRAIGPATDVWAVGLVALRLLTGESYWTAKSNAELMVQLLVGPMANPSERWPFLGKKFDAWFARSCDRDASKRWSTIAEQVERLSASLEGRAQTGGCSMNMVLDFLRGSPDAGPNARSEPGDRTVTAFVPNSEVSRQSDHLVSGTTSRTNLTRTAQDTRKRSSSRVLLLIGGTVAALSIAGAFAYRFVRRTDRSPEPSTSALVAPVMAAFVDAGDQAAISPPPTETPAPTELEPQIQVPDFPAAPSPPSSDPFQSAGTPPRSMVAPRPRKPRAPASRPVHSDDDLMRP